MGGDLKEIAPAVTRVALLFNPETSPQAERYMSFVETSSLQFGMRANAAAVHSVVEMETAIEAQARSPGAVSWCSRTLSPFPIVSL